MQADGRMRVQQVRKWYQEFKNGQRDICDNYCTGGPRTSRTVVNAA